MTPAPAPSPLRKGCSIALLAVCVVLTLSLWFSVSAVIPTLKATFDISDSHAAWLSSSVSVGFVFGTIVSAALNLADTTDPRRFFAVAALIGATANGAILLVGPETTTTILLRFVTGASMAGVYPVGMRIAATWATRDIGFLIGILTAGICAGSGLPHLIDALAGLDWKTTVAVSSGLALLAGGLVNLVGLGPTHVRAAKIHPIYALRAVTVVPLRLANLGYWGHKWENYAMWAWIGPFLHLSFVATGKSEVEAAIQARLTTFAVFVVGAAGCLAAGWLADRFGRTLVAGGALAVSGSCAILAGLAFGGPQWLVTAICLVWGFALIADSAQFSAAVIELSDRTLVGTMLTVQTCVGYMITLVGIHAVEALVSNFGWTVAFAALALGPAVGIVAMIRLRRRPEAVRLASGKR